jgi:magnesium-transporting ATPase (P-type)
VLNFLPLALLQRLKSVINCFYLFNAFLQTIPEISTNTPLASLIPILWVIFMGMLVDLITDLRRWKSDKATNNLHAIKLLQRKGTLIEMDSKSEDLQVGDVIVLKNNMQLQADCIVLDTEEPHGLCYISTSNLDGERNLKPKQAMRITRGVFSNFESYSVS